MLYNKSVLLIAPCFHDYHDRIVQALEVRGASVVFFPERDYSIWFKLVNNLANRWLDALQAAHYQNILKKIAGRRFDYLFVVRGYKITPEFIRVRRHSCINGTRTKPTLMRRFFPFSIERTHSTSMTVTNSDCNTFRFSTQTTSSGCANRFLNSVLTISFSWAPIYPNDTKHSSNSRNT